MVRETPLGERPSRDERLVEAIGFRTALEAVADTAEATLVEQLLVDGLEVDARDASGRTPPLLRRSAGTWTRWRCYATGPIPGPRTARGGRPCSGPGPPAPGDRPPPPARYRSRRGRGRAQRSPEKWCYPARRHDITRLRRNHTGPERAQDQRLPPRPESGPSTPCRR